MAEYIDKDRLRLIKTKECAGHTIEYAMGWKACVEWVKSLPAADVRPVVRGHYVGEYDGYADGNPVYDMWYCSECGCCFEDWDEKPTYNFCPNCGADMREVDIGHTTDN